MSDYYMVEIPYWLAEKNNVPMVMYGKKIRETNKAIYFKGSPVLEERDSCFHCNKEIKNSVGKLLGIRPKCAEKMNLFKIEQTYILKKKNIIGLQKKLYNNTFKAWLPKGNIAISEVPAKKLKELQVPVDEVLEISNKDKEKTANRFLDYHKKNGRDYIKINFPYDEYLVERVNLLPEKHFNKSCNAWLAPLLPTNYKKIKMLFRFDITDELKTEMKNKIEELKLSRAKNMELDDSFLPEGKSLYPFQKAGLSFIEKHNGRVLLADEPGLGKTIQTLAYLEKYPNKRPALIIPPATLKINWAEEIDTWLTKNKKVYTLNGETNLEDDLPQADIYIANYSILYPRLQDLALIKPNIMIMDESHEIRNKDTKKSQSAFLLASSDRKKAIKKIKKTIKEDIKKEKKKVSIKTKDLNHDLEEEREKIEDIKKKAKEKMLELEDKKVKSNLFLDQEIEHLISITGTPIVNKTREIFSNLELIKPDVFDNFFWFGKKYCNGKKTQYGWDFDGASNLNLLNEKLRDTVMVRRLKKNVLDELPEKTRATIKVDITNQKEYNDAENHFIEWLESIDPEKAKKAQRAETLTKINYLKQLSIDGKMSSVRKWIDNFIYSDEKLIVFAHHQKVIQMLSDHYGDICVTLSGKDTEKSRDEAVKGFMRNDDIKLFIGNIKAAGVGLTLTKASNVLFIELGWTPKDHGQAEDRAHRIRQKNAVTAWYLLGKDTIDEKIYKMVNEKKGIIKKAVGDTTSQLNDNYIFDTKESLLQGIVDSYSGKNKK